MTARTRKLIGSFGLMAFLAAYVWAATAISDHLPDNTVIKLVFFGAAGVAWGLPVIPLITWMNRGRAD